MDINKTQTSALNRTAEEAFKTFVSYLFKNGTETKVPSLNNSKYLFYKTDLNNAASKIAIERWRQRGRPVETGKDDHQMVLEIPTHIAAQVQDYSPAAPSQIYPNNNTSMISKIKIFVEKIFIV